MKNSLLCLCCIILISNIEIFSQNGDWEELGPSSFTATSSWQPGIGPISDISIDPANGDHILVGSPYGGVWKTLDGGQTWQPLTDAVPNNYVGAVEISPHNPDVYYYASTWQGGIFKSEDAGQTWSYLNTIGFGVEDLRVRPDDPQVLIATNYYGIHYSGDDGANWINGTEGTTDFFNIEFKPDDPSVVYVAGRYDFFRSPNGGESWGAVGGFSTRQKRIAVSNDDPNRVYLIQQSNAGGCGKIFGGLFVSMDAGFTFNELDHGNLNFFGYSIDANDNDGSFEISLAANPENADELFIGGALAWQSTDGGVTFRPTSHLTPNLAQTENIGYCHQVIIDMKFNNNELFLATQGGFYVARDTQNLSSNYFTDLTDGLGICLAYRLDVSQDADPVVAIGALENGGLVYSPGNGWRSWHGDSGVTASIDRNDSNIVYGLTQNRKSFRTDDGGNTFVPILTPAPTGGACIFTEHLFVQDPVQPNTVYLGKQEVYKSTDYGNTWQALSQGLLNIRLVQIAESSPSVIYAIGSGFSNYKSLDGGNTWQGMSISGAVQVRKIAVHPTKPNYVGVVDTNDKIFVSFNGGGSWVQYNKNLTSPLIRGLAWHDNGEDGLYVGTDNGVYYIDNTRNSWFRFSHNLPRVPVFDLKVNPVNNRIYVATLGRGVWSSPTYDGSPLSDNQIDPNNFKVYPNPASNKVYISFDGFDRRDISILDISGKRLKFHPAGMTNKDYVLDISHFNSGVYFLNIISESGTVTRRIIKN